MLHNYKLEIFDQLNFLKEVAEKGSNSLPDKLTLFLTNELEIKGAALLIETTKNNFNVIGKYGITDNIFEKNNLFSIKNYDEVNNNRTFGNEFTTICEFDILTTSDNLQSIAFSFNKNSIGILVLNHKTVPAKENLKEFSSAAKLVKHYLSIWKSYGGDIDSSSTLNFTQLVESSSKGFRKVINTINGLVSILNEEQNNNSSYIKSIKQNTQQLLNSVNDLIDITQIKQNQLNISIEEISLNQFLDNIIKNYKSNFNNIGINVINDINKNIRFDKTLLTQIINYLISITHSLSSSKEVLIKTNNIDDQRIGLTFTTITNNINIEPISNLSKPFALSQFVKNPSSLYSGLSLSLVKEICDLTNSNFNIVVEENNKIRFTLSLLTNIIEKGKEISINLPKPSSGKNRILVIESDEASSTLLNNYLSKWNYKTDFVNDGNVALKLLKENKYIAVILNIDQQNDNSLELLQKIKNNKATQNTPVIVFSIEPEKEKVFLMGSVEYLVKPINYNNLVEILTSYKLRRNSNVLCVDDDQPTLKLVEQAIQTAGFNVISEYRPELVIDLISDKDIDLAIVDLDMPKLNGFDLIKQIKTIDRFAKLPIIIYTGKEDYQEDLEKIDGMFVELLDKKSTSFNELERTISDMIKSYEEPKPLIEKDVQTEGPKILMAEDYKHSQIIVTRLLKKNGFEDITVVENGEEALRICEKEKIDLILMDMQMPVMNGFEATGEIRELSGYEDTPIIALTAFAMKGDREKCLEAGATDYIAKPIDSKEFIEKVKYYSQQKINS